MDSTAPTNATATDDLTQLTKNPTPSLGDAVEEFEENNADFQAMYGAGGHFKEQLEAIATSFKSNELSQVQDKEIKQVEEVLTTPELTPEIDGYVEKVEKDSELARQLADDYVQAVGMQSTQPKNTSVKLPLTQDQIQQGLHRKVWEAIRWLAEWCLRQMKMVSLKRA